MPSDASLGDHQVCTQGGSCLTLRVVQPVDMPTPTPSHSPTADGRCIPAAPLGVAVGHTWTLAGPIQAEGDFSSEDGLPEGASEGSSSYTVTAITDSKWVVSPGSRQVGGEPRVLADYKRVQVQLTQVVRDADGNVLDTQEDLLNSSTIYAAGLGPVLTLDWDCHRQAWLQRPTTGDLPGGGTTSAQHSVDERALSSGATAVLFLQSLRVSVPEQDMEITTETVVGYDKLTGRLVLTETRSSATRGGEQFSVVTVQELVSEGTVTVGNGGQSGPPKWLTELIHRLVHEPVANPPLSIIQYEYNDQMVYFVPQRCCDIFSDLYDADGNIIGHPDGGITGRGDGRVPDFFEVRRNERLVWEDERTHHPSLTQVPAPIESVEVLIMESSPPQYAVGVVSGLPDGCTTFGGYRLERGHDTVRIEMLNWRPADPKVACDQVYRTVETSVPLGSDFERGKTYTVVANDVTETFVAQ